ncbi:hypothetical protein TNCV_195701 [Trichonephila clavipes]|uniref:Uncharacterized protein n=1 Tax=Trichonephila clavipes TaxID=2585209 RepID=A0A8X6WI11_TRICX|nr:hypothetical protein TNCV_195701 [Trichonephila clavipes]
MPINLSFLISHEINLQRFWLRIGRRKQSANCVVYLPLYCESRTNSLHRNNIIHSKRCHIEQQRVCEILLLQRLLCLFEKSCKSPAEDAELRTVRVSQKSVEMPDVQRSVDVELGSVQKSQQPLEMLDTQHAVDADLGTILVPHQLVEMPHAPSVQAFAVRLVETFR